MQSKTCQRREGSIGNADDMLRVRRIDDRSFQADAGQAGALQVVFPEGSVETRDAAGAARARAELSGWFAVGSEGRNVTSRRVRCSE